MLLHQQLQDNMLDEEVVSFGQRAQQQQDQQQLQLRQHNISHNPVLRETDCEPKTTFMWKHQIRVVHLVQKHCTSRTINAAAGCSSGMGSGIERDCS